MKSVVHLSIKNEIPYYKNGRVSNVVDRFKTKLIAEEIITDLNTKVRFVDIPANFNDKSYNYNIRRGYEKYSEGKDNFSSNGIRKLDFPMLSSFQKKVVAYSITESIKVVLLKVKKSIKNANILIDDGASKYNKEIIEELAKEARSIILVTKNYKKVDNIREKILCNYGTTIEVIDKIEELSSIDFIISTENKEYKNSRVWYIDNLYEPSEKGVYINKVEYKVPWESSFESFSPELIGGILKEERNKDIKELLIKNGIILERISFNSKEITI